MEEIARGAGNLDIDTGKTGSDHKPAPAPAPGRLTLLWRLLRARPDRRGANPSFRVSARHFLKQTRWWLAMPPIIAYRFIFLRHVPFIVVTGSLGKTSTVDLTATILSHYRKGLMARPSYNTRNTICMNVARARPWHRYFVQEISAVSEIDERNMELLLSLLAPRIGVVTCVGTDHLSVFGSQDEIAAEKSKLPNALPPRGLAILNADDARVMGMRGVTVARAFTIGTDASADLGAVNIESRWPEPLSMHIVHDGRTYPLRTGLHGTHWVTSILCAIAVALELGITVPQAIAALESSKPTARRMQPIEREDGIFFLLDDFKASVASVEAAIDFMRSANANRKIAVFGTISDYQGAPEVLYRDIARAAAEVFDHTIFIGNHARRALSGARSQDKDKVAAFISLKAASPYIAGLVAPGDLILLKGGDKRTDLRVLLDLERAEGEARAPGLEKKNEDLGRRERDFGGVRAIVGLGNGDPALSDTRHNIGHRVLDRVADDYGLHWSNAENARIAELGEGDPLVRLVKMMTDMNVCGPAIEALCAKYGIDPSEIVLVYDETQIPVGRTKMRMNGSAGGHNGVYSVLEALDTDQIRRLKVGVGQPRDAVQLEDYVLEAFTPEEEPMIEAAVDEAAQKLRNFLPPAH